MNIDGSLHVTISLPMPGWSSSNNRFVNNVFADLLQLAVPHRYGMFRSLNFRIEEVYADEQVQYLANIHSSLKLQYVSASFFLSKKGYTRTHTSLLAFYCSLFHLIHVRKAQKA